MAFTVTTDLSDVDLAEATTDWTANSGALDPDFYVQGSNSLVWNATKNGRRTAVVANKSVAHSSGDHLYFWMASSVAAKCEPKTTGTTTASGLTVRVTLANSAYREWHVAGSDTWGGEWRCFVVDMDHTGSQLYASSGTWTTASNVTTVTFYYDLTNSGNIRNAVNTWNDAVRIGTGITAYNTSAADAAFDLTDIAAVAEATAQAYGVTETIDGVIFAQGKITVGDSAGTNHVDFDSQDEVLVFGERNGSGIGIVADGLYELIFTGNATGTDQDISMGVKVGTGDTATGRNGTIVRRGGTSVRYTVDWSGTVLHNVTIYGSTFQGAFNGTGVLGVDAGSPTTTHEVIGCSFDGCGQIDLAGAVARNNVIQNSQETGTTFAALLWASGSIQEDASSVGADTGYATSSSGFNTGGILVGSGAVVSNSGWVRIPGVGITQGTTITSALLTLRKNGSTGTGAIGVTVYGVDEDNHTAPTTYAQWNTDHGIHTTASVAASITPSATGTVTIDVTAIVQEIINRAGWSANNAIGFHLDYASGNINDTQTFFAGSAGTNAPRTHILTAGGVASDIKNSLFVNNTNAIEVRTLADDISFVGMEFSGNTTDVRYEGGASASLNWTDASGAPSITNAGNGVLTAVNTVTLTLTNVVVGSQCAIYTSPGGVELMNETAVSSTVTEPYAFTSNQDITVRVRNSSGATRYFPYTASGTITSSGFTLRIDQIEDTIAS